MIVYVYISIIILLFIKDFESKVIENNTVTGVKYGPEELLIKLFNLNNSITPRRKGYGLIKFEGDEDIDNVQNFVSFQDNPSVVSPIKFQDDNDLTPALENNQVVFQDDIPVQQQKPVQKKKKRRRRRPRAPIPNYGYPGPVKPMLQQYQGQRYPGVQSQNQFGLYPGNYAQGYGFPPNRPPRRRPAAPDALSSIITALTSIARYDDQQCVPRLLCEAAGGALGNAGWLQTVAGLQPLLTILSAYNGVSASPLFVFGRAVFLGMTSKGNPTTCRYAYNTCPTDPEELVHYLNNHNGGFFRFFNAPQRPNGQQNLEQFYNQLSGQYGYLPNNNYPANQGFGYPEIPGSEQQNYGLYRPQNSLTYPGELNGPLGFNGNQNQLYNPQIQQNYGNNYPHDQYQYGFYNTRNKNELDYINGNRIQKRIQNKPNSLTEIDNFDNNVNKYKLAFPDNENNYNDNSNNDYSSNSHLFSFPGQNTNIYNTNGEEDYKRDFRGFQFPENQYYRPNNVLQNSRPAVVSINNNNSYRLDTYTTVSPFQNNQNFYNGQQSSSNQYLNSNRYSNQNNYNTNNDQTRTVYIVRGNGDPNNPEVVQLRPGENVSR